MSSRDMLVPLLYDPFPPIAALALPDRQRIPTSCAGALTYYLTSSCPLAAVAPDTYSHRANT